MINCKIWLDIYQSFSLSTHKFGSCFFLTGWPHIIP